MCVKNECKLTEVLLQLVALVLVLLLVLAGAPVPVLRLAGALGAELSIPVDDVLGGLLEGTTRFGPEVLVFDGLDELVNCRQVISSYTKRAPQRPNGQKQTNKQTNKRTAKC